MEANDKPLDSSKSQLKLYTPRRAYNSGPLVPIIGAEPLPLYACLPQTLPKRVWNGGERHRA